MRSIMSFSFPEQLALNAVGPVLAAMLGTVAIAIIASRSQNRRERATRDAQERRDNYTLRERLITDVLSNTSSLYWATLHYLRAQTELSPEELKKLRQSLDAQY